MDEKLTRYLLNEQTLVMIKTERDRKKKLLTHPGEKSIRKEKLKKLVKHFRRLWSKQY